MRSCLLYFLYVLGYPPLPNQALSLMLISSPYWLIANLAGEKWTLALLIYFPLITYAHHHHHHQNVFDSFVFQKKKNVQSSLCKEVGWGIRFCEFKSLIRGCTNSDTKVQMAEQASDMKGDFIPSGFLAVIHFNSTPEAVYDRPR